ncbi:STN domain-containing protein [Microbacteriaceae bacterium K1510]|nr:STN domain-containing protein [Microbacteriaceae bacterium K1510]
MAGSVACGAFAQDAQFEFDIPAQTLAVALDAYGDATGLQVFYDGALAQGRRSGAVKGRLSADAALRDLLTGTGLVPRKTNTHSITIVPSRSVQTADSFTQTYFSAVQTKVSQALCARPETRPGDIDRVLRLWISPSGVVQQARSLGADERADEPVFDRALRGLAIGVIPPADLPQPIVLAIMARTPGQTTICDTFRIGRQ